MIAPMEYSDSVWAAIDNWIAAEAELKRQQAAVNSAECAVRNALIKLGRAVTPEDAQIGEKFSIWIGDAILEIQPTTNARSDFSAHWRNGKLPVRKT